MSSIGSDYEWGSNRFLPEVSVMAKPTHPPGVKVTHLHPPCEQGIGSAIMGHVIQLWPIRKGLLKGFHCLRSHSRDVFFFDVASLGWDSRKPAAFLPPGHG
jgi:hypothetical protein